MSVDKNIRDVIEETLNNYKQPFIEEFITFIDHVLLDAYTDDEVLDRINSIDLNEE